MEVIEALPLANTPDVFGLHPNAEIGYSTTAAKDMWTQLVELQPQTGGDSGGKSREEFIGKIAADIQEKLPTLYDVNGFRKKLGLEISPTTVVLLQELDVLIRKMGTTLMNLQRVNVNMKQRLSNIGPFRKNLFQYPCHQRSLSVKVICCPLQIEYDVRVNCFDMVLSITACIRGTETPEHDLQPSTANALYYFYK
ncbi:dynein axonemal heavy chain 10-like [Clytia hemisphaerica]|uniref:Dynein heavy chain C-terminal domain-containing protein n=1 Tax=Clytia hemisphaerica TaxID=252671 RepID=A0A7M5V1B4_9CNID